MEMVLLPLARCKAGMTIGETLYNDYGAIIIAKGSKLDDYTLGRIKDMGQVKIKVFPQDLQIKRPIKDPRDDYRENMEDIKQYMSRIRLGLPFEMSEIRQLTDTVLARTYSIQDLIGPLSRIGSVEEYEYTHHLNVAILAMAIGRWMNCKDKTMTHLVQAGLLHDIGKCKIPVDILHKPGPLTKAEYRIAQQHPVHGYRVLKNIPSLHNHVLQGILTHHEREDGSGYPVGMTSERINLIAKILAVADIFDAMTSNRTYRQAQSPFQVFELMENGSFGKLHPVILNKFLKTMASHYQGVQVELNNGLEGEIVFINSRAIARPIVKVEDEYIDLSLKRDLKIKLIVR